MIQITKVHYKSNFQFQTFHLNEVEIKRSGFINKIENISGINIGDCQFTVGEYTSTNEQYLEKTDSASDCVKDVKARAPNADAMTWAINTKDCWAKFDSSNSSIDPNGCSYCQSCFFSKNIYITFDIKKRYHCSILKQQFK